MCLNMTERQGKRIRQLSKDTAEAMYCREGVFEISAMPATWTRTHTSQFSQVAHHCRIERANQLSYPMLKRVMFKLRD